MFVLMRAVVYASVFVGLVLVYLPTRLLSWSGLERPESIGASQFAGMILGVTGATIVLWCVLAFVFVGRGTPAPFDPPRRLVVRGPYRFCRNPMYVGAGLTLGGAALFYTSLPLLAYTGLLVFATHLFVIFYEEPTLRRSFGPEYADYCGAVPRWWPRLQPWSKLE